nr:3-keto-5-aminohexanoate cleavage protein [Sorangium cellulosum]
MEEQIQKAVDCYSAGATVLHVHAREADGKGSKRLSRCNELLAGLRDAVPEMILQVGGSISFSPEGEGAQAKWLSDDTRHMLAELSPKPDQVTIAINTTQMNVRQGGPPHLQDRRDIPGRRRDAVDARLRARSQGGRARRPTARGGLAPVPLPSGIGVKAAGVVEASRASRRATV